VGAVTLSKQAVVASIHALQPYTVSWSNVPDYMTPRDFHKLARAISATEDTVHFMHRYAGGAGGGGGQGV
jgi:hypothetical protein